MRERVIWISAGLLGLVLAAAMASATSRVATPDIGLAGEPVAAGALAPPTSKVRRSLPAVTRATARPAKRTAKRAKKRAAPSSARRAAAAAPATPAASAPAAAATPAPTRTRTRARRAGPVTRATAKSPPAVKARINRPAVPPRIPTPPPTVTVDDHGGGGDVSGKDHSGDGSGKGGGASSGGGKTDGGGDD
jgi:uncharacterized membrane protein YgcG